MAPGLAWRRLPACSTHTTTGEKGMSAPTYLLGQGRTPWWGWVDALAVHGLSCLRGCSSQILCLQYGQGTLCLTLKLSGQPRPRAPLLFAAENCGHQTLSVPSPVLILAPIPAGLSAERWPRPASSSSPSRWQMEGGERISSPASSARTCRVPSRRSTTPAGPCLGLWLSGKSSPSWPQCSGKEMPAGLGGLGPGWCDPAHSKAFDHDCRPPA